MRDVTSTLFQRAQRLARTLVVSTTTMAATTMVATATAGAIPASGRPVLTLFASPAGAGSTCISPAEPCSLGRALEQATAPEHDYDAVVVVAGPGTYDEGNIGVDAGSLASLTIKGAGASLTTVQPGIAGGFIFTGGSITVSGLSINGSGQSAVAVHNDAGSPGTMVTLAGDCFTGDKGVNGGAVTEGPGSDVTVTDDTFADDRSLFGNGGALFGQGRLVVTNDTFSSDGAPLYGGAVFAEGDLAAEGDTFVDDSAASGGAVATVRPPEGGIPGVTLTNNTFVGDMATANLLGLGRGGALANLGSVIVATQDTFSADEAASGRGAVLSNRGDFTLSNSIIDGPRVALSCDGAIVDGGYNVESDDSCGFEPTDNPPSLVDDADIGLSQSLAANGATGPETLAITPTSSAFGEVPARACSTASDERGWPRPGAGGSNCDAGAFEYFQLTIEVSGAKTYLSSGATFNFADDAPPGITLVGSLSCSTVDGGTPLSSLGLGDYTVDGSSCTGLTLSGTSAGSSGIVYTGVRQGFVVEPSQMGNDEKRASNFIAYAESALGEPYVWGAGRSTDATAFDCSGLVVYSLLNLGYSLVPLDTYSQFAWATPLSVQNAYATPGALLFGQFGEDGIPGPGHVAISLGNGYVIEAPHTGTNVSIVPASLTAKGILTTGQPDVGDLFTSAGLVPGLDYDLGIADIGVTVAGSRSSS